MLRSESETRISTLEESLKELAETGSPVDLSVAFQPRGSQLEIEQSGESLVFQLDDGRIAYWLDVAVNKVSKIMWVADLGLRLSWAENVVDWLVPQTITGRDRRTGKCLSYEQYRFPGKNCPEPTSDVINENLMPGNRLSPGRPICGLLLAIGGMMPPDLFHGGLIDATLVIRTTDHAEHCGEIRLLTDRPEHRKQRLTRKSDLFEELSNNRAPNKSQLPERRNPGARILDTSDLQPGHRRSHRNTFPE